jgi:hypothetical protein
VVTLPNVTDLSNTDVIVTGGAVVSFPGLTTYDSLAADFTWQASGTGSVLDLGSLTYLEGQTYYYESYIQALSGGQIDLGSLVSIIDPGGSGNYRRAIHIQADGVDSRIDLSTLQRFTDTDASTTSQTYGEYSSLKATGGGQIALGSLDSLEGIWVQMSTADAMDLYTLTKLERGRLELGGGTLTLAKLSSTTLDQVYIYAYSDATIAIPTVTAVNRSTLAAGSEGLISLPMLNSLDSFSLSAASGGVVDLPALQLISRSSVTATSLGTVSMPTATQMDRTNLTATAGGVVSAPSIIAFDSVDTTFTWQATGAGSVIDLSGLEYLEGQTYQNESYVQALAAARLI